MKGKKDEKKKVVVQFVSNFKDSFQLRNEQTSDEQTSTLALLFTNIWF